MLTRLRQRWIAFKEEASRNDRQYGWLFPAIAPFLVLAVVMITLSVPLVAHWQAVEQIKAMGGHIRYSTASANWFGIPDSILTEAKVIKLTGETVDDAVIDYLIRIRGSFKLSLQETRVTTEGLEQLHAKRPDIVYVP